MNNYCCPQCGNSELQIINETNVQTSGKNYSGSKGCLGYLLLGPLGLLCGSCGSKQKTTTTNTTYWICPKCGNKFRAPDDIRKEISDNNKKFIAVLVCVIIIALCGSVFFFAPYKAIKNLGIFSELIALVFSIVCFVIKIQNKKREKEAYEIEQAMLKFKK